jgi:deoxyhypusine synthase
LRPCEPDTGSYPRALPPLSNTRLSDVRRSINNVALHQSLEVKHFNASQVNESIDIRSSMQQSINNREFLESKKNIINSGKQILSRSQINNKM